ncbi:hypothetical protein [uncultured Methanobrevibacter sp.]|nr:hypothetical protein [uncultured Methanobrevibacter sp.]
MGSTKTQLRILKDSKKVNILLFGIWFLKTNTNRHDIKFSLGRKKAEESY